MLEDFSRTVKHNFGGGQKKKKKVEATLSNFLYSF